MLPTFPINNFKPWAPPPTKPLHRTPSICSPRTQNSPHPRPSHALPPSTLPLPKHHLPARPPAEVCMNEISRLESEQSLFPEISKYDTASRNSVPHVPAADPNHHCNSQDNTENPAEPPAFRGDYTARGLSSPRFLRLPEAPDDNIPVDPVILADLEGWEDLQPHAPQADSLITTEKACPYPDPPTILYSPINYSRDPNERVGGKGGDTQTSNCDHLPTNSCQQVHPSPHSANPKPSFLKDPKQLRARSLLPPREDPFTALQSHFMSLPLDDCLQFLSWLFEGTLSRCMSDTLRMACEEGEARATCHLSTRPEMEQSPVCRGVQGSSRKGMPWSAEEADLLVKLKKDEGRTWSEVAWVFSKEYPGRSQGAIQVFWSTVLNKKAA
ncbi:hypothetical protein BDW66DRAFT_158998 [Aspergillus desertorum]